VQISDKNKDIKGLVLLAVICLVLQLALAPNIGLGNGRANFALIFVAVIALSQGGGNAVIAGFVAGLLFDYTALASLGVSLVYSIAMLASGQTSSFVDAVFLRALPTTLLTLVAFLPFAYYYSRIKSSGPNLGGRGGHFKRSL
jgi:cell shape-determining protein MreD